jgi:electron transfer flavoprotein beta subunit
VRGSAKCVIGLGPALTPAQLFDSAEVRFTKALTAAQAANDAALVNLARVGRARALLGKGDGAGAATDAALVPQDFVFNATHDLNADSRNNRIFAQNNQIFGVSVAAPYRAMTIDGVPDPRVRAVDGGRNTTDQINRLWTQQKYTSLTAGTPIATGIEARLILAEVRGAGEGVGILNALRARSGVALPPLSAAEISGFAATVMEERNRELWLQGNRWFDMNRRSLPQVPAAGGSDRGEDCRVHQARPRHGNQVRDRGRWHACGRGGLKYDVNDFDLWAIEAALQLKEKNGNTGEVVVVICLGPDAAQEQIRKALAMGADRGVLLKADARVPADGLAIARALAAELKDGGLRPRALRPHRHRLHESDDGPMVAELLDLPCVTNVCKLDISGGAGRAERVLEGASEVVEFPLPALLTIDDGLNKERLPSLKGIMAAKKKPLDVKPAQLGEQGVGREDGAAARACGRAHPGREGAAAVPELVRLLQTEAKVL